MKSDYPVSTSGREAFGSLRNLMRDRTSREQCEVCSRDIPHEHAHLFEPKARQVICVCAECQVSVGEGEGSVYRRVPRRVCYLEGFCMDDAQWDELMIPVGMAFFFHSSAVQRVLAFYPSPAGVTESLLDLEAWQTVVQDNPVLASMQIDVEALLVNRTKENREYFIVPIDKCYELAGHIRCHWRGLSGGQKVWEAIEGFYTDLKAQSTIGQGTRKQEPHA